MKILGISVGLLLCATLVSADFTITQEVEQLHPGGTSKMTTTIKIKGDKVRIDHEPLKTGTIIDHATGKSIALFYFKKTYRESSKSQEKESLEMIADQLKASGAVPTKRPQLRATGKQDVIKGWKVEEYVAETKTMKATYWVAKELQSVSVLLRKSLADPRFEVLEQQFPDPKLFPGMPVVTIVENDTPMGKMKSTTTLVSVKDAPIPDSEFFIPQGYKRE